MADQYVNTSYGVVRHTHESRIQVCPICHQQVLKNLINEHIEKHKSGISEYNTGYAVIRDTKKTVETVPNKFSCLIPDVPLSGYERFAVGATTGGALRGAFRNATVYVENEELVLKYERDIAAGGGEVSIARIPINNVAEIQKSSVSLDEVKRSILYRSLGIGGAFSLALFIVVTIAAMKSSNPGSKISIIFLSTAVGFALGFIISFASGNSSLEKNLAELKFIPSDNKSKPFSFLINPNQTYRANLVLNSNSLFIKDR